MTRQRDLYRLQFCTVIQNLTVYAEVEKASLENLLSREKKKKNLMLWNQIRDDSSKRSFLIATPIQPKIFNHWPSVQELWPQTSFPDDRFTQALVHFVSLMTGSLLSAVTRAL